jgi:putative oxidoreductase
MRIIVGLLFVSHGRQKISGWFGGQAVPLGSLFGVAGIIEIVLGLLIIIGLFAGYAAFIASGEMAVAYFIGHFQKVFGRLKTKASRRCCSALCFLYMATQGAGIWSADAARAAGAIQTPVRRPT